MNMEKIMKHFLNILKKNWICRKKLGKSIHIFYYHETIKGCEFDIKYLFLTNNLAENINK